MDDRKYEAIELYMTEDVPRTSFWVRMAKSGQDTDKLISDVQDLMREHNLSALESNGFLDYMKLVVNANSYIPKHDSLINEVAQYEVNAVQSAIDNIVRE